jgi:hypothetical protein
MAYILAKLCFIIGPSFFTEVTATSNSTSIIENIKPDEGELC